MNESNSVQSNRFSRFFVLFFCFVFFYTRLLRVFQSAFRKFNVLLSNHATSRGMKNRENLHKNNRLGFSNEESVVHTSFMSARNRMDAGKYSVLCNGCSSLPELAWLGLARLSSAPLHSAWLGSARLRKSLLSLAPLRKSSLSFAPFRKSSLSSALLHKFSLISANLRSALLRSALLCSTRVGSAWLSSSLA